MPACMCAIAELVQGTLMWSWNVCGVLAGVAVVVSVNATPTAAQIFQHPGVLVNQAQLAYIKAQYTAKVSAFYQEVLSAQASTWVADLPSAEQPVSGSSFDASVNGAVARRRLYRRGVSGSMGIVEKFTLREAKRKFSRLRGLLCDSDHSRCKFTKPNVTVGQSRMHWRAQSCTQLWLDISPSSQTHTIME